MEISDILRIKFIYLKSIAETLGIIIISVIWAVLSNNIPYFIYLYPKASQWGKSYSDNLRY